MGTEKLTRQNQRAEAARNTKGDTMKNYLTLIGLRYKNGESGSIAHVKLTAGQARLLARMHRNWENGQDGNLFRQAATSFADDAARKMGIVHYASISY